MYALSYTHATTSVHSHTYMCTHNVKVHTYTYELVHTSGDYNSKEIIGQKTYYDDWKSYTFD